MIVDCY